MIVKTITYSRTKNLGNYESERLEMTIEIEEDENPEAAAIALKSSVNYLLAQPMQTPTQKEELF